MAAFQRDRENNDDSLAWKNTFINKHVLRTIGFALCNKSVKSETKKMIQLVRHQFSRKRSSCLSMGAYVDKAEDASEERDLMEIIRDSQLDELCVTKPKSPVDKHLEELRLKCETLMGESSKKKDLSDNKNFILSYREAEMQVASIKADALKKLAQSSKKNIRTGTSSAPFIVNRGKFFHKMNNDQKDTGQFILDTYAK